MLKDAKIGGLISKLSKYFYIENKIKIDLMKKWLFYDDKFSQTVYMLEKAETLIPSLKQNFSFLTFFKL